MARKLNSHPERCPETPATPTSKQHVECRHLGPQVDGSRQEVEGGCILLHGQVDEAQVVENLPIKGSQVVGPLQAADGLHTNNVVTSVCMHTNTPVCLHTNIVVTPVCLYTNIVTPVCLHTNTVARPVCLHTNIADHLSDALLSLGGTHSDSDPRGNWTLMSGSQWWATQVVKHMSDPVNQHNNGAHQDQIFITLLLAA